MGLHSDGAFVGNAMPLPAPLPEQAKVVASPTPQNGGEQDSVLYVQRLETAAMNTKPALMWLQTEKFTMGN